MKCNLLKYEKELYKNNISLIAGVDEAGRGPLAGPVVAAAVILPKNYKLDGLNDSKQLTEKKREEYFFKVFNVSKIKYDKDYFILLTIFLISLYGVPIQTMGFYNFNINDMRVIKSLSIVTIISGFLLYVLFCRKSFEGREKNKKR